ncbi:Heparin-sulfate lyase precursor [Maioricimonas rarisocia]|uniref:Heparin-sulfate lyase n=1 Tax=Maioricimonas rarisocia TaxID=2528026 RepID=A0A517Z0Z5_9PLAN|nr:alginate lyase family protein [Maioricimonas rarisocia]QDU36089.1 Heparin-sulfate lyase precursor [Maioricimonas rarisocia]
MPSSLTTTAAKLIKMSPDEIRIRVAEKLRKVRERRMWRGGRQTANAAFDGGSLLKQAVRLVPGATAEELKRLEGADASLRNQLRNEAISRASQILNSRWRMLGHDFDLTGEIDWHRDPVQDHQWPRTFYADVPLHQKPPSPIDVKYIWELGRHQYLVELARAWRFTGESRYVERVRELILSWIDANRLYEGVHWTSGLEVAVRPISWIWALAATADWDGWNESDLSRIAASLHDHATFLEHHFSWYSSPYNHIVGEATGLYLIALLMPDLPEAARWKDKARAVLNDYGPRQFHSDGFCVEQATGYHYFSLGFLTLAVAAARKADEPLEMLETVVHRAFRTGMAFRQPDGRWPAIGDIDSARAIPVCPEDFWDFNGLCSLGATLFEDESLKPADSILGEELFWLLGCDGVATWRRLDTADPTKTTVLEEAGYAIASDGDDWMLFDAGPLAHGLFADGTPSSAHGHLDTLQVLYVANGQSLLVDAGMPWYFGDADWVRHFRGAAAHNIVEIEGVALARDAGGLAWNHAVVPSRLDAQLSDDAWICRGEVNWNEGVRWRRHVLALPGKGLWIADQIDSDAPRTVRWNWQLPAASECDRADDRLLPPGRSGMTLQMVNESGDLPLNIHTASDTSPRGWLAPGYGQRYPAGTAVAHHSGASRILTLSALAREGVSVTFSTDGRQVCISEDAAHNREVALQSPLGADAVWRIEHGDEAISLAVGATDATVLPTAARLDGVGNWPCLKSVEALSSTTGVG